VSDDADSARPPAEDPEEVVDAVPVLLEPHALEPRRPPALVTRQAAAVAATSFAAGIATVALSRLARTRAARRRSRRSRPVGKVIASQTFLVDVHLLARRD
jgi:hypothetical protein